MISSVAEILELNKNSFLAFHHIIKIYGVITLFDSLFQSICDKWETMLETSFLECDPRKN